MEKLEFSSHEKSLHFCTVFEASAASIVLVQLHVIEVIFESRV